MTTHWTREQLFFDGDSFFDSLIDAMNTAAKSIYFQTYIYHKDELGDRIALALAGAARRGVDVRVIVDGIGSMGWMSTYGSMLTEAGAKVRVYHQVPWEQTATQGGPLSRSLSEMMELVRLVNRRNHRKIYIVDGHRAYLGSMNVHVNHLPSVSGENAWRDTGVAVEGPGIAELEHCFLRIWVPRHKRWKLKLPKDTELVRLNGSQKQRRRSYLNLLLRIRAATTRVWITNSYFVPERRLLSVLKRAARRGVDVRIVIPKRSDVFFIPWVSTSFYPSLMKSGVKIFEYTKSMLHAKTVVVDDWALVGSSNLNHRSLFHDLEADVVLSQPESRQELAEQFLRDLKHSVEMSNELWARRPWWERTLGSLLLSVRYWL